MGQWVVRPSRPVMLKGKFCCCRVQRGSPKAMLVMLGQRVVVSQPPVQPWLREQVSCQAVLRVDSLDEIYSIIDKLTAVS